ncbi:MAG: 50S ribosomal protein L3 [Patescibacteria group bacterium]|nr:MAG: 50S ribosomal protein L3 [Patescibacteria group bacterium]
MPGFILGIKKTQKRVFNDNGQSIPVTEIYVPNLYVIDIKTQESDGYFSIKVGMVYDKKISKPLKGELEKLGIKDNVSVTSEFRLEKFLNSSLGLEVIADKGKSSLKLSDIEIREKQQLELESLFKVGDVVDVSGVSKGKGFQGVVRRFNFGGGPKTHGQSDRLRAPGSIGAGTTPGRVFKGKKMAGRMGGVRVTVQNLPIVSVGKNSLVLKGLIPGYKGSVVQVRPALKFYTRK